MNLLGRKLVSLQNPDSTIIDTAAGFTVLNIIGGKSVLYLCMEIGTICTYVFFLHNSQFVTSQATQAELKRVVTSGQIQLLLSTTNVNFKLLPKLVPKKISQKQALSRKVKFVFKIVQSSVQIQMLLSLIKVSVKFRQCYIRYSTICYIR